MSPNLQNNSIRWHLHDQVSGPSSQATGVVDGAVDDSAQKSLKRKATDAAAKAETDACNIQCMMGNISYIFGNILYIWQPTVRLVF